MKWLFLRGQVPYDRPTSQIMFSSLDKQDDCWCQLFYELVRQSGGIGEMQLEGGKHYVKERFVKYSDNFSERWVARYAQRKCHFEPDVIFARGGFKIMRVEALRYPKAFKIHYGAGQRVIPAAGQDWDLVLVDTPEQCDKVRANGYNSQLFIKPAADNIFKPVGKSSPDHDVIFCANWNPNANKGHRFVFPSTVGYRVIHSGVMRGKVWKHKWPHITFTGWIKRSELPKWYSRAKIAVVRTIGKDSCPRVIPEALACNVPILIIRPTQVWYSKYVTPETGEVCIKDNFQDVLKSMLLTYDSYSPRAYYDRELSLSVAAKHILSLLTRGD